MWFHIIFELDQAKPSVLDQDYLKYSNNAVVTGKLININFLEFFLFQIMQLLMKWMMDFHSRKQL